MSAAVGFGGCVRRRKIVISGVRKIAGITNIPTAMTPKTTWKPIVSLVSPSKFMVAIHVAQKPVRNVCVIHPNNDNDDRSIRRVRGTKRCIWKGR